MVVPRASSGNRSRDIKEKVQLVKPTVRIPRDSNQMLGPIPITDEDAHDVYVWDEPNPR
ncbi:conserved hypothetical protein [Ricinus communis]|uniref:Uncharacterized protein n=1 Tax=Ricinus communis TaxID=3988 RepID=B9RPV7_RICCO|nr:conserved hypothetical protein [Ricinus communis]